MYDKMLHQLSLVTYFTVVLFFITSIIMLHKIVVHLTPDTFVLVFTFLLKIIVCNVVIQSCLVWFMILKG